MARTTILRGISMNSWARRIPALELARHIRYLGSGRSANINREMLDKTVEKIRVAPRINNARREGGGGMVPGRDAAVKRGVMNYSLQKRCAPHVVDGPKNTGGRQGAGGRGGRGAVGEAREGLLGLAGEKRRSTPADFPGNEIHSSGTSIEAEIYFPSLR